jgi:outer membrane protein assembly factor BamA
VRAAVVILLLAAASAGAQETPPSDDDPKSTITEWPPKPKPPAPKPNPPPTPPNAQTPNAQTPNAQTPNAQTPNAQTPNAQTPNAQTPNAQTPNAKPPTPPTPAPPKPQPQHTPAPLVGSPFREIPVPKGQNIDSVQVAGAETRSQAGLGEPIVEIKIVDNTKTDTVTVEYISGAKVGEILTTEYVEKIRLNLLSSDLFKDVLVYWEPGAVGKDGSGVRLVISAKDKLSWIVAPLFFYSDRNIGGGIAYGNANVLGHNKKFLALAQYATSEKMIFVAFLDPQIHDSRFYYRVDFLLRRDNIIEYAAGHIGNPLVERATDVDTVGGGALVGVNFTRRFHLDLRLKLYYDRVNPAECYNTTNRDGSGTPDVAAAQGGYCRQPSSSGWDNTLTTSIAYDGRAKVMGVQSGLLLQAAWQYGASWLGTRWDYHLVSAYGLYAWRFFKQHNLILKLGFDVYFDPPFKQEVEAGGAQMRGFLYRQFRGDTDVRLTAEYILPLFTIKGFSLRAVGFYDSNLTWFRDLPGQNGPLGRFVVHGNGFRDYLPDTPSGLVRDSWHNGIGAGLRMYLTGVVLPLVGVDFAYGLESQSFQFYLALGGALD